MAKKKDINLDELYDKRLIEEDLAGKKRVDEKALEYVLSVYERYKNNRIFERGGKTIDMVEEWDKDYRIYKAIYLQADHNYDGEAQVFNGELRKAVNVVESEGSNALFSRQDFFSVDPMGSDPENVAMSREAFAILNYYSSQEDYVQNLQLALKQCLIYGSTWVETVYDKNHITGAFRRKVEVPVRDTETGEPLVDEQGQPVTKTEFKIERVDEDKPTVRLEARDVYRMYVNHFTSDPEKDDIIYRDAMSIQDLIEMRDRGVYNEAAVNRMLAQNPTYGNKQLDDDSNTGQGKSYLDGVFQSKDGDKDNSVSYEVLRFQGLFTEKDEKTGVKIRRQYWIDIGERNEVLRCIPSPVIGGFKTFSGCNYDTMVGEFYTDSVISPYRSLQYELNDKENQGIDALTFNLNSPIEVMVGSGIDKNEFTLMRKEKNPVVYTKKMGSVARVLLDVPVNHLNNEQIRLQNMIQEGTGATSLASGAPTGTQVDRSGKALGTLLDQTRSQFSKFVRKFEKRLLERSMQKVWDIIIQFFDDEILIAVEGQNGVIESKMQTPAEVVGRFRISVSAGSQYLKEREFRDSILELLSIAGMSDKFMETLDVVPMFQEIAMSLSPKLARYINPDNLVNKQAQMIKQLQAAMEQMGEQNKDLYAEAQRLQGELKQTERAAAATPGPIETKKLQEN